MTSEILLIEDSESDAEIILRALKRSGISNSVKHLSDGEEALDYILARNKESGQAYIQSLKLIYLDLKMPKINGIELIERLKSEDDFRMIPIVVLTSSNENRDINEAYKLGANSYVVKSADYETFSRLIVDTTNYWININTPPVYV